MSKRTITPLMIFGIVWLLVVAISWIFFPGWQKIPGGFLTLAGLVAVGVLAFLRDGVDYLKAFLDMNKPEEKKSDAPSPTNQMGNPTQSGDGTKVIVQGGSVTIQQTAPPLTSPAPSGGTPVSGTAKYIPRGIEQNVLAHLRNRQHTAIVGVSAPGGIGKTELANQISKELIAEGTFERALWVDCGPKMTQDILIAILRQCDASIPLSGRYEEQVELLKGFLRDKKYLVVLDDVREANVKNINDLLPPDSHCAAIITSRIQQVSTRVKMFSLKPMTDEQALQLLESELGADILIAEAAGIKGLITRCRNNSLAPAHCGTANSNLSRQWIKETRCSNVGKNLFKPQKSHYSQQRSAL